MEKSKRRISVLSGRKGEYPSARVWVLSWVLSWDDNIVEAQYIKKGLQKAFPINPPYQSAKEVFVSFRAVNNEKNLNSNNQDLPFFVRKETKTAWPSLVYRFLLGVLFPWTETSTQNSSSSIWTTGANRGVFYSLSTFSTIKAGNLFW